MIILVYVGEYSYLDLKATYHEKRSKIERAMIKAKIKKAKTAFLIISQIYQQKWKHK